MSISIYQLKPKFQQLLAPLLSLLIRRRVTPNQITLLAMSLSVAYGAILAVFPQLPWLWMAFPFFMLLRMALNAIDGMLANASGQKTNLGALLNELCDQLSDLALYLPFVMLADIYAPLLVAVVIAALLAEFAGVSAALIGSPRRFDGPMGKSDRAFVFGLLALMHFYAASPSWQNGLLGLSLLLLGYTIFNRLRQALRSQVSAVQPTL
ncbi:CDP-alcohol phosphatidyltransferase family protein [Undibacterium terreum]|uniref:CDP-alcohol phosphatidyltransferase n=1 Tax=Undibacterium terreum TaxID=1224302 RepID=A0A916UZY3_9BURK|nr:CDP-alcohol phosphatidyltransferase family protein [Undibacterium terreum]GGC98236.1 CDP-alcohol phosphatidyltransferase [Undibacterium terreum]